jgi:hypothetical protein
MMDSAAIREPTGIRELLDCNPIAGEMRKGPRRAMPLFSEAAE